MINRQEEMKKLVLALHDDKPIDSLKKKFKEIISEVSPTELAEMEQSLIDEGLLTAEQVTKMCDLHVAIFQESLDQQAKPETIPGHPLHTYMLENNHVIGLIEEIKQNLSDGSKIEDLKKIIIHYTRLENQLFPLLEKTGVTGPSTVMWAIHDEVREEFKNLNSDPAKLQSLLTKISDMVYKEDHILFPMALETLSASDWGKVRIGEEEIGYAWITPGSDWKPISPEDIHKTEDLSSKIQRIPNDDNSVMLELKTGNLTLKTLDNILRNLPVDISFIDAKEEVQYYSATEERLFPRSPGVIGRKVQNCHPQKSMEKVQKILDSFKEGSKDVAEFWIQIQGKFIYIRYFAVRDEKGTFLGTLEVSQDITEIRKITGEKRLLDW